MKHLKLSLNESLRFALKPSADSLKCATVLFGYN
jgi:hypothetical protein